MGRRGTNVKKHTHRYQRVDGVWYCGDPNCLHYMPKNIRNGSVDGRLSVCWNCGKEFVLDSELMQKDEPVCFDCHTGFGKVSSRELNDLISRIGRQQKKIGGPENNS